MSNDSSPDSKASDGLSRFVRWLLHRRVIANMIWLATAAKDAPFPAKPDHENLFSKPVAWLLGRQVISALKWMLLSAAYQGRLDSRNWMKPNSYSFAEHKGNEFWFDYLADSGDGQKAMYSIAYLCLSDLWVAGSIDKPPAIGSSVSLKANEALHLPRGEFLFVGGDTAYHIADYPTLAYRFQLPFHWAANDLNVDDQRFRRPLFGIPGNHDYYDEIEGFHRQFRAPVTPEDVATKATPNQIARLPQLRIPTFKRCQEASYVAIQLPYDWWLWGLDAESEDLGTRQREFFRTLPRTSKLIVATSQPTTFMGRYLGAEAGLAKVFEDLALPRPFLETPEPLPQNTCRLDLAGDIHRYARYWGPKSSAAPAETPSNKHYASVVSGLGGAVVHPWESRAHDILEQVIYPTTRISRIEVAKNLLNPIKLATGGGLWLLGALLAIIVFFGAAVSPSSKNAVDTLFLEGLLGINEDHRLGITSPLWPFSGALTTTIVPINSGLGTESFRRSLWILGSFIPLILGVIFSVFYSKYLKAQVKTRQVMSWEYWPVWLVYGIGLLLPELALWTYGSEPVARVVADIVFAVVVASGFIGLIYLAIGVGAKRLSVGTKVIFAVLGISHAMVQLALPFLLMRLAGPLILLLTLVTMAAFAGLGILLTRLNASRWFYLIVWLGYATIALLLPILFSDSTALTPVGWLIPSFFLIVALVGLINLSVWFGWYLLVSLAFSGHNDEAAGATRIEKYKQFIRFHLTPEKLTGYVIAIDEPQIDGRTLKPRIIDVFSVQP